MSSVLRQSRQQHPATNSMTPETTAIAISRTDLASVASLTPIIPRYKRSKKTRPVMNSVNENTIPTAIYFF